MPARRFASHTCGPGKTIAAEPPRRACGVSDVPPTRASEAHPRSSARAQHVAAQAAVRRVRAIGAFSLGVACSTPTHLVQSPRRADPAALGACPCDDVLRPCNARRVRSTRCASACKRARGDSNLRPAVSAHPPIVSAGRTISSTRRALGAHRLAAGRFGASREGRRVHDERGHLRASGGAYAGVSPWGGSPAGLYTFRRHCARRAGPVGGSARDRPPARCRAGWGFPEFTRFAAARRRAGPLLLWRASERAAVKETAALSV